MQKTAEFLATFGYLGKSPKAPGTVGTIGALPLVWAFFLFGPFEYMILTFLFVLFAIFVCTSYEGHFGTHDASEVVIDEVAGFLITMTWLPLTWQSLLIGFILFRILDIAKPFPIGYVDKNVKGGVGVVVDDVAAGIIANVILQIVFYHTNWLGMQYGV